MTWRGGIKAVTWIQLGGAVVSTTVYNYGQ